MNAWIGSAGVVAQTHYDTSHNIYVPLLGAKRFELWPPRTHAQQKLHPSLHQYYRQAQRRLGEAGDNGSIDRDAAFLVRFLWAESSLTHLMFFSPPPSLPSPERHCATWPGAVPACLLVPPRDVGRCIRIG